MNKWKWSVWIFLLFMQHTVNAIAASGNLFSLSQSGIAAPLDITLCLNGNGPLTCQRYSVNNRVLDITTIPASHLYSTVGIKVNTPGYAATDGCTDINNGYCIFSVSDTSATTVVVEPTNVVNPGDVTITVTGSPLGLDVNQTGTLTINNTSSTTTATNIASDFTSTALDGKVTETGNTCASVPPNSSCTLTFTAGSSTVSLTTFIIHGDNALPVSAAIAINPASTADIVVSGSPLSLETNGVAKNLTITNTSSVTATNIASDFTGTALDGNVTETTNTCSSVAPHTSCTLSYTPGATPVGETFFTIQGSNTNSINAAISITAPANAEIAVANSPLLLNTNGQTGNLTITNLSSTITATNITSTFTGTALAGKVTETANTCTSLAPNSTCTITYTPGSTAVPQTTFTIQGSNTDKIDADIQIASLNIGTSFGGGVVGCLTSQGGAANLIAANANTEVLLVWSDTKTLIGASSDTDGATNTVSIVASIGSSPAFAAPRCSGFQIDSAGNAPCQSGFTCYNDWYLPATNELSCLEVNQSSIGGFSKTLYWTSTEANKNSANAVSFSNGGVSQKSKTANQSQVRCVRTFTP